MANIKSQIKRIRTTKRQTERSKGVRSELKTHVKKARETILEGKTEEAATAVRVAGRRLDKAAEAGIIHKRNAANRKSGLAKLLAKGAPEAEAKPAKGAKGTRKTAKKPAKATAKAAEKSE